MTVVEARAPGPISPIEEHHTQSGAGAYVSAFLAYAKRDAILAAVLALACALSEGLAALALVQLLAAADADAAEPGRVAWACFGLLSALTARGGLAWARDKRLRRLSLDFVDHWRSRVFRAVAFAEWPRVSSLRRADMEHAVLQDVGRLGVGADRILQGVAAAALAAVQIAVIAALAPVLAGFAAAVCLAAGLVFAPLIHRASKLGRETSAAGSAAQAAVGGLLSGLKLAKVHRAEHSYVAALEAAARAARDRTLDLASGQAAARARFQVAAGAIACLCLAVGLTGLDTPPAILAIALLAMIRLTGPLQQLLQGAQAFAATLPAFRNLAALEQTLGAVRTSAAPLMFEAPSNSSAALELRGLRYTHDAQRQETLRSVDLQIAPGEIVGLRGRSGAGKTTLLDLIAGLLRPSAGDILLDGRPLHAADFASGGVAYAPQEAFLFDATVRENLSWTLVEVSDEAIWNALAVAGADETVRKTAKGLDARAGEGGRAFSGGERQRLCLARALLRRPRLLLLDEALSALDPAVEKQVLARLRGLRSETSILFASHRGGLDAVADRVLTLHNGCIIHGVPA